MYRRNKHKMDCPICYEAINAKTGVATLSCSHSYHISCLSQWFSMNSDTQSCPFCRHEANETEKLHSVANDEDDDSDDEDDDEDDTIGLDRAELNAIIRERNGVLEVSETEFNTMDRLDEYAYFTSAELNEFLSNHDAREMDDEEWGDLVMNGYIPRIQVDMRAALRASEKFKYIQSRSTEDEFKAYAASRIAALIKGCQKRIIYKKILEHKNKFHYHTTMMKNQEELVKKNANKAKFYYAISSMTIKEVREYATDMIKRAIQRRYLRKVFLARNWKKTFKTLLFTDPKNLTALERILKNKKATVRLRCNSITSNLITVHVDEIKGYIESITKAQALWRSYKVRKVKN